MAGMPFDDPDDAPVGGPNLGAPNLGPPGLEQYAPKAFSDQGNAYGPVEQLPGISSGAPPKPWGLQEPDRGPQAFGPEGPVSGFSQMIARNRPADYSVDQRGQIGVPADSYGYRFKGKGAVAPPGGAGAAPDRSMEIQTPRWSPWLKRGGMSA